MVTIILSAFNCFSFVILIVQKLHKYIERQKKLLAQFFSPNFFFPKLILCLKVFSFVFRLSCVAFIVSVNPLFYVLTFHFLDNQQNKVRFEPSGIRCCTVSPILACYKFYHLFTSVIIF